MSGHLVFYPSCSSRHLVSPTLVRNLVGHSLEMSSRQTAPPLVYPSANGVRAPPQVGKSRVKGGFAAFGRRRSVGTRQAHCQTENRLRRRVDMERSCTSGAVEWTWDTVAFGRRCWLGSEREAEGVDLRERRRLGRVLRRFWEAPKSRHQAGAAAQDATSCGRRQVDRALRRLWGRRW